MKIGKIQWVVWLPLVIHGSVAAQVNMSSNAFTAALQDGIAFSIAPKDAHTLAAVKAIQATTGSDGDVSLSAIRVLKFKQQPTCGRVSFALYQESTRMFFGKLGGELNLCEDGSAPLRICKEAPNELVPADTVCADSRAPIDTPEVAAAINEAIAAGGLTGKDIQKRLHSSNKAGTANEK